MLSLLFHRVIDILMIRETEVDDSFPTEQLIIKNNFLTSRLDKYCFPNEIEIFCIELNFWKKKWHFFCCYNPHKHLLKYHLFQMESVINFYSNMYETLIILGDFNAEISDLNMESFCTINNLQCIIKEPKY